MARVIYAVALISISGQEWKGTKSFLVQRFSHVNAAAKLACRKLV